MTNGYSVARYLSIVNRMMGSWERERLPKQPAWVKSVIEKLLNEIGRVEEKAEMMLQIEKLRNIIRFHAHLYYNMDQPRISDSYYDKLINKLEKLEEENPELVTPDSPTQLVGGAISAPLREER